MAVSERRQPTRTERGYVEALRRRRRYLAEEIEEFRGDPDWETGPGGFVRHEFAALGWALRREENDDGR